MDNADMAQAHTFDEVRVRAKEIRTRVNSKLPPRTDGGACIDCEEQIGEGRLVAHPNALRCVECQSNTEEGGG